MRVGEHEAEDFGHEDCEACREAKRIEAIHARGFRRLWLAAHGRSDDRDFRDKATVIFMDIANQEAGTE